VIRRVPSFEHCPVAAEFGQRCEWHADCVVCGETIHLGALDRSPGIARSDEQAVALVIGRGTGFEVCATCWEDAQHTIDLELARRARAN
jgi:hypothetical protein